MGTALARTWLAADHPLTVWNRTPARAAALAAVGAEAADSAAEAVAANPLVLVCLMDDASVQDVLTGTDLTGKDLVNLTTGTPAQARARAEWARERGARYLDGGDGHEGSAAAGTPAAVGRTPRSGPLRLRGGGRRRPRRRTGRAFGTLRRPPRRGRGARRRPSAAAAR